MRRLRQGTVRLVPHQDFAIAEYEAKIGGEGSKLENLSTVSVSTSFVETSDSDGVGVDKSEYRLAYFRNKKREKKVWTSEFVSRMDCTRDRKDFYLSHFGIPEPKREAKGLRWLVIAMLAAFAIGGFAWSRRSNA